MLVGENAPTPAGHEVEAVLKSQIMLTPSVQHGSGPFPDRKAEWIGEPHGGARIAAASFYLALMTATALQLIGARGPAVIEGPFAVNALFAKMLAAATARPVIAAGTSASGTSIGAALLAADGDLPAEPRADVEAIASPGPEWEAYAAGWRERAACRRIGCP